MLKTIIKIAAILIASVVAQETSVVDEKHHRHRQCPPAPCHRKSSSSSSKWPTWYPTVESSSSSHHCHRPPPAPAPCPPRRRHCRKSSSSSSSCSSSSSSSSLPSCPPRPFLEEFTYKFKTACKKGALMTVLRKAHACKKSELIIKDGCTEIYNSKEHQSKVKLEAGEHQVTMTMISDEQYKIYGTSVNPNCPRGKDGMCFDFQLYKVCFCNL